MKPPERIRLRLLGRLAIAYGDGGPPIRLSTRKAGALIAYLAMSPEQTASREELATLLWGASTDQQARQSLRQALVLLRKELGWSHFMAADAAVVRLQPGLWSIDAADFDRLSRSSEPEELARAAELFGGEFLTGLNIDEEGFDEWVAAQRQRVQLAAARLCESFAARPELVTDPQQALGAVERLVALDPLREDWQRLALTLYARYRGRNEALAQAEVFAETLRRELGVAPEKATRALIEKIRASEAALEHAPIEMIVPAAAGNAASAPLPPEAIERVTDAVGVPPNPVAAPPVLRPIRLPRPAAAVVAFAGAILLAAIALTIPQLRDSREEAAQRSSSRAAAIERWRSPGALPGPSEQPRAAIAVLPFVAQGNAALQPSADAMTDDLINVLARVPAIRVISRATMESYRDRPIDVAAVAAELDVSYVLEGVVRAAGDKLRVNVELIDPATRSPAWGARIERASDEEGKVRDEIVAQLARELQLGTPAVEAAQAPADPTLRQLYQQGWAAIHASGRSPETLQQAMLAFSRALAQSGQSRWAKIGLANTHALAAAMAIDADRPGHLAKAEELLAPLIAENANSAGPYFAMGLVHEMRGRPLEAIDAYKRVVASNPSHAPSYAGMGHALILAGKAAEGLGYIQYAQRLSPRDAQRAHWLRFAGEGELELGHIDKALDLLRQSQELAPRQVQTLRSLAVALAVAGRIDEAQRVVAEMRGINPGLSDERLLRMARTYDKTRPEFLRGTQLLVAPAALVAGEASSPADQAAKTGPAKQNSGVATILILPFGESGEDNENSRLSADIMTDDLTNAVSRVGGFRVISRQTAATYRGKRVDPKAVGAELGVQYVIEGRVEARGEVLRASVELIDAKSGLRAWSGNYERGGDALPVVVDEVVRSVGRELQVEVNRIASSRDSGDPDVHTLIYKGFSVLGAGWRDADALAQAEKYFTEARARDPNSTRAMTGLGAYHVAMALKLPRASREAHLAAAESLLRGVIARRPDVGGPSMFLGMVSYLRDQDDEAIRWFERELERNPSQSRAYAHLGRALTRSGKPEEGLRQILYAIRLSPNDPAMPEWLAFAGGAELELGHAAKAIEYLERAASLHAASPPELIVLAAARALEGDLGAARMRLDQAQQKSADFSRAALAARFVDGPTKAGEARLSEGLRLALAPARDPWASPASPMRRAEDPTAAPAKKIIPLLVLPFTTSGDAADATQLLADQVTDDLTNVLSRVARLRVISRQTALSFKGKPIDIAAVGKELEVRYVLEGTMRMHEGKLRINLELTDPATRLPVWTTRIDHADADRDKIVDEIVERLARELQIEMIGIEAERRLKDNDTGALVARGWAAISEVSAESFRRAESYFRQALERNPDSIPALLGMGAYHARIGGLALDAEPLVHRGRAEEILREVIRRDPRNSMAHFYLGLAIKRADNAEQSIEHFERAIELNPSLAAAYVHIGDALTLLGRAREGIEQIKYGLQLSPKGPGLAAFLDMAGDAEVELGHFDLAIDDYRHASTLMPAFPRPRAGLSAAYALAGHIEEAHAAAAELRRVAATAEPELLINRFGRNENSRYRQGLRLALNPAVAATAAGPASR